MLRNPLKVKSVCPWGKEEEVRDLEILVFLKSLYLDTNKQNKNTFKYKGEETRIAGTFHVEVLGFN